MSKYSKNIIKYVINSILNRNFLIVFIDVGMVYLNGIGSCATSTAVLQKRGGVLL
jgi:hypothetical protein